jgi:Asp-tRNA(Asn)/Glu-tRNA(Gln) amidotransferase C subunit
MSKTVVLPNSLEIIFPDNATDKEMSSSLAQYLLTGAPAQELEAETETEAVEVERPEATGKFFKSIGRGIDQMQGAIGSGIDVIGEATGIEAIEKFGERQAARNEAQLLEKEIDDPRLQLRDVNNIIVGKQSWVDYIQQSLGEVLPSMGISLAGAGAGALAGSAVFPVAGSLIGGAIGAFLPSTLMGTGEVQQTIKELDPDAESPWAALGGGAIIGALDVAALSIPVLKSIGKGVPKDTILKGLIDNGVSEKVAKGAIGTAYKSVSNIVKNNFPAGRVGKGLSLGIQSAGAEGLTERLQELTSIEIGEAVTDKEVMNRAERLLEATVMGVIAGAGLGGGAGVITGKNYDPASTPLPEIERGSDDEIILSGVDPIAMMADETLIEQEEVASLEPEQIKWNTPVITGLEETDAILPDLQDPYIFTDQRLGEEQLNRLRNDETRLTTAINKVPALFMDTLIYGDTEFTTRTNKPQTIKYFGEKFNVKSINERDTIFNALVANGRIEPVGKNKWKYSDTALKNKNYRAISNKGRKNSIIFKETTRKGNKTTIPAELNGKKITIIEERKNKVINGREVPYVRYDVRGQGNKGGKKLIYKDKDFRQFRMREFEFNSLKPQIFDFMNKEHVGVFADKNLRSDPRFPVGTEAQESFEILLLGKDIKDKNDKPYKNFIEFTDDIKLREKDIDNLIQDKALKQKEQKRRRRLRNPVIDTLIEAELTDIDNNIANAKKELVDRKLLIKGFEPVNTIAKPITIKQIEKTLTARERKERTDRINALAGQAKDSSGMGPDGTIKQGMGERAAKDIKDITNPENQTPAKKYKIGSSIINFWNNWVNSGVQISNQYPLYKPFHEVAKRYDQTFRSVTALATQTAAPFAQLNRRINKDKRYNVQRALYAGMLTGSKGVPDNGSLTYTISPYYSYKNYGVVRDNEGNVIEDEDAIREVVETYRENNPDGPLYTKEYFQQALDEAVGGPERNAEMYKYKVGEEIKLTDPLEVDGINSLYLALDGIYQRIIEGTVNQAGSYSIGGDRVFIGEGQWWDALTKEVADTEGVNSVAQLLEIKAEQIKDENKKSLKEYYKDIANVVNQLEEMKMEGYFPSVREGNGNVRIFRYERQEDGKLEKKTAVREEVVESFKDRYFFGGDFQRTGQKYVDKHMPNWNKSKPEAKKDAAGNYIPEEGLHGIEFIRNDNLVENEYAMDINMPGLERILLTYDQVYNVADEGSIKGADPNKYKDEGFEEFQKRLKNIFSQARRNKDNRSFKAHTNRRKGIPGFVTPENMDTYWTQAFGLYTAKAGRYIARLETENDMRTQLEELKKITQADQGNAQPVFGSTLFEVAKKQAEFLYSPQSAASFFKTIAFNGFLGGNISSLMVNLSQLNVAASFLFGAYGLKGRGQMLKGAKDASIITADIMFAPASFIFLPVPTAGKPKNTWTAAERAGEEQYQKYKRRGAIEDREIYNLLVVSQQRGTFGKINTEAIAQNADVTMNFVRQKVGVNETIANPISAMSNFLTTMYASGEMVNRIATTLAAARLARKFGTGELRNFAEGIPGQNTLLNVEINKNDPSKASFEEMVAAGELASNATQFNLDPFNRSRFSRQLGGSSYAVLRFCYHDDRGIYKYTLKVGMVEKNLGFMNDVQKQKNGCWYGWSTVSFRWIVCFTIPVDDLDDVVGILSVKLRY